jgi:uncharacterized coiled-coil protein SlyX
LNTCLISEQITELRWLVDELGHELDALTTTPYSLVHRFLMRNLTTRIARVAVQVQRHLAEQPPHMKESSDEMPLVEQSA